MQPTLWQPPIEPSLMERAVIKRIRRAKLFVFLREHRHDIFNKAFQEELSGLYRDSKRGQPPIPPAQLALATLLQAYTGASDDEVIEATTMDRRWQLVLDCLDAEEPPFSKGTLIAYRNRLIERAQPSFLQDPESGVADEQHENAERFKEQCFGSELRKYVNP